MISVRLTQKRVHELFSYDATTGILSRRKSVSRLAKAGQVVGWKDRKGYLRAGIDRRFEFIHRVIWLYVYGYWPTTQIDHINGVKDDNRIANLRLASASQNKCNSAVRRDSQSGIKGVHEDKRTGRWRAEITLGGKRHNLGFFATIEEAAAARARGGMRLHGEFAKETSN